MGIVLGDLTDTVELVDDKVNKYLPKDQLFRPIGMLGLQESTTKKETTTINISSFLMNKDLSPFQNTEIKVTRSACFKIELPKDVTRNYPYAKFIPVSTRFTLSFDHGDITKPKIIAGRFENTTLDKA